LYYDTRLQNVRYAFESEHVELAAAAQQFRDRVVMLSRDHPWVNARRVASSIQW